MTVPNEYRRASAQFDDFLGEVANEAGLTTRHQAYTTLQGVLVTFRRRLTLQEAVIFVQVLPPMLRALFVEGWDPHTAQGPVLDQSAWSREIQELRINHNISPADANLFVSNVLWRSTDRAALSKCLSDLPAFATDFWPQPRS